MKMTHDGQSGAGVTIEVDIDGYGPLHFVIAGLDIAYAETRAALVAMIGRPVEPDYPPNVMPSDLADKRCDFTSCGQCH